MKKNLTLLVVLFSAYFTSCNSDPRKELISNEVQTIFNTKTDLSFKIIEFNELSPITVKDSIASLDSLFTKYYKENNTPTQFANDYYLQKAINISDSLIKTGKTVDDEKEFTNIKTLSKRLFSYRKMDKNKVLANRISCKFTAKNPFLGMTKQEIVRIFYFSPDNKKILDEPSADL